MIHDSVVGKGLISEDSTLTGQLKYRVNHRNVVRTNRGFAWYGDLESAHSTSHAQTMVRMELSEETGKLVFVEQVLDVLSFSKQLKAAAEDDEETRLEKMASQRVR